MRRDFLHVRFADVAETTPAGYIVMQQAVRAGRPVQAYQKWMRRIPGAYHEEALGETDANVSSTDTDPACLKREEVGGRERREGREMRGGKRKGETVYLWIGIREGGGGRFY